MLNVKSQVISGVKWSLIAKLISQLFSWAATFVVIRILTPEDYGIIEIAAATISFAIAMGVSGFADVIVQKKEHDPLLCSQVLTVAFIVNSVLFCIMFFSAPYIGQWYESDKISLVIQLLSFNLLTISMTVVPSGILKRDMKFKQLSLIQMVTAMSNALISLILALNGYEYWSIPVGAFSSLLIFSVLINIQTKASLKMTLNFKGFSHYFKFGAYTIINNFLTFIFLKADVLIIGKLLGTRALGFYSVGSQLANLPLEKVAEIMNQVSFSGYAKVKNDSKAITYYYLESSKVIAALAFPIFLGLASISKPTISIFLGDKWLESSVIFQIMALVMPIRIYQLATQSAISGIGFPKFNTKNLIGLCLCIPTSVLIGIKWGISGAAIGWTIGYCIYFIWMMRRSLAFLKVKAIDFIMCLWAPLFSSIIMLGMNHYLYTTYFEGSPALALVALILSGMLIYLLAMYTLDKNILKKIAGLLKSG